MQDELSSVAALFADPARAAMLVSLLDGRALPAGELARAAGISPQAASNHLTLLRSRRLLEVEQEGRHRYYRLCGQDVAGAIEALASLLPENLAGREKQRNSQGIAFARKCYNHLAGRLAVQIFEQFEVQQFICSSSGKLLTLTERGRAFVQDLGIDPDRLPNHSGVIARRCLDWTERKHHVAGALGAAVFSKLLESGWLKPVNGSRIVRVTDLGRRQFERVLGIAIPQKV